MYKANNSISLKLASPEKILEGSFGEVLKPETYMVIFNAHQIYKFLN